MFFVGATMKYFLKNATNVFRVEANGKLLDERVV